MPPKILVGCPTSHHKAYCLKEYAEAVKSLDYPNYDILLVDNSPDEDYINKIKEHGLSVIKGHYFEGARDRIIASRNILRQKAIDEGYDYFFSLEQDVIPPRDIYSLSRNIIKLCKDDSLIKNLGKNARESILKNFDSKKMIIDTLEAYRELLNKG